MSPPPARTPDGVVPNDVEPDGRTRCEWATGPWNIPYHDTEWGVPVHDDRAHFEFLVLEGAQAGLSWLTILKKRDGYRRSSPVSTPRRWLASPRSASRRSCSTPALSATGPRWSPPCATPATFLAVQEEFGSFDTYLWGFVGGRPKVNKWRRLGQIPATTPVSEALSADLRRRDFRFVGPTVCYPHLQAAGLVNDHVVSCFRYAELTGGGS